MIEYALLASAGFAAGLLNAIAGGGTFFTLPALVYVGVPPVVANATSTLVVLPGYISSAWAYRGEIRAKGSLGIRAILVLAVIGSLVGSALLVITPGNAFLSIVPWLLLVSTVLFALGPMVTHAIRHGEANGFGPLASGTGTFLASVYGGYFNGGLGIMMLALFGLMGFRNLHGMNGLKSLLAALLSIVSVAVFVLTDLIAWEFALLMAVFTAAGGYVGAFYSQRLKNTDVLRAFVTLVGLTMTVAFFLR